MNVLVIYGGRSGEHEISLISASAIVRGINKNHKVSLIGITKDGKWYLQDDSEYKRIYEIGSRYPDVTLTLVQQAFSNALFDNRTEVNINDIRQAIVNSKNIYQDVINKALPEFDKVFADEENELEVQTRVLDKLGE